LCKEEIDIDRVRAVMVFPPQISLISQEETRMKRARLGRKGLAKAVGRPKADRFEQDLTALRRAKRLVDGMSPAARKWLRSKIA